MACTRTRKTCPNDLVKINDSSNVNYLVARKQDSKRQNRACSFSRGRGQSFNTRWPTCFFTAAVRTRFTQSSERACAHLPEVLLCGRLRQDPNNSFKHTVVCFGYSKMRNIAHHNTVSSGNRGNAYAWFNQHIWIASAACSIVAITGFKWQDGIKMTGKGWLGAVVG